MDSSLLDALECAICLNPLNASSRVLPCQHTFCLRCLQEVVAARGVLQCPECRTLVSTPVAELPQNIVLIRLLESVRAARAAPPPARPVLERGVSCDGFAEGSPFIARRASQTNPLQEAPPAERPPPAAGREEALASLREALREFDPLVRPAPAAAACAAEQPARAAPPVPCARALYSYAGDQDQDLPFKEGDVIQLRRRIDFDWFEGQLNGRVGVFPANRVTVVTPLANHIPQCRALSQFTFPDQDGKTYLRFNKGEIVTLIRPVDKAWAEGKIGHRTGEFPLPLVELNSPAQSLLRTHGCMPSGGKAASSAVPPLPPPLPTRPARSRTAAAAAAAAAAQKDAPPPAAPPRPHRPKPAGSPHVRPPGSESKPQPSSPVIGQGDAPAPKTHKRYMSPPLPRPPPEGSADPPPIHLSPSGSSLSRSGNSHKPLHRVRSWGSGSPAAANTIIANRNTRPERSQSDQRKNGRAPTPLVIQRYRCTMDYPPSSDAELELRANDIVFVHKKRGDGWMKGTHEKTGKTGLFPATFVELC